MIQFTLYTANCSGNVMNCTYPEEMIITDEASMLEAIKLDHVSVEYKNSYRSSANFIQANNLVLDCDNDHSETPEDWVTGEDVAKAFPGVPFVVATSRNHMRQKEGKSARPRFHVYFTTSAITDSSEYTGLKKRVARLFPFFDQNALDSARFIFGSENVEVTIFNGDQDLVEFLDEEDFKDWDAEQEQIPEGKRNSTMSRIAGRIIKRYGDSAEAHGRFLEQAEKCNPPLDGEELRTIWTSATSFGRKVAAQEDYIPPEVFNSDVDLKPGDYSDVGQAEVLAREYADVLRYSPATDYIVYNGSFWEESKPKAQAIAQELTTRQLEEAEGEMEKFLGEMSRNGALDVIAEHGEKKAMGEFDDRQRHSFEQFDAASGYRNYAIKRRDTKKITAALVEARPMVEVEQRALDAGEFLLNTPSATYDLRLGLGSVMEHDSSQFITKQTAVDPSTEGIELWKDALDMFFLGDQNLIDYVQKIVGLAAIGKVYVEALIIAYGDGRNGKSTFWNAISRVLGSYSGNISADMLTVGCRRNVKPELAEAKGKRLLIAAEMEEGMRLNTANVKQLCSTDEIFAEKKYKDPFSYVPSHTLVLYTNHLPKVGALDAGIWRRLIVIPFEAKIEGEQDVKNYGGYLFDEGGGAILAWVVEGARAVIADGYHIEVPSKVRQAIQQYRENNDWLAHFLEECCDVDSALFEKSGELYTEYRAFCFRTGEYTRSTTDFYTAIEAAGFERRRRNTGAVICGLKLKSEFLG